MTMIIKFVYKFPIRHMYDCFFQNFYMLIMILKLFIFAENFVKKSIELNERSNGTTSIIRVEPNQKINIACFSQGTSQYYFLKL